MFYGKKYAFLIGINYFNTKNELLSAYTDLRELKKVLLNKYHYKEENISFLCDRTIIKPTKSIILDKLNLFIEQLKDNDIFLFYFSGHGKEDGIFTIDEQKISLEYIVFSFKDVANARLIFIFDCCFEGSYFMKYNIVSNNISSYSCNINGVKRVDLDICYDFSSNVHVLCSSTLGEKAYTGIVNKKHHMSIFTYSFLKLLNKNKHKYRKSFKHLLSRLIQKIKSKNFYQRPFLGCNKEYELYENFFI